MIGILLQILASFMEELSETLGKENVRKKREDPWTLGFLNAFMAVIGLLFIITFIRGWGTMTLDAWPTFLIRTVLLLVQSVMTVKAIVLADRSTFGFLRVGTIPLLLIIDLSLGVVLTGWQVLGMLCIATTILLLTLNHGLNTKGIGYILFGTVGAAFQLSLLRYNVTHGNSVELEQLGIMVVVAFLFLLLARRSGQRSPWMALRQNMLLMQSSLHGLAVIVGGYAFLFAPASILLATARGTSVMAAVLAGHWVFHEKRFALKIAGFIGCGIGIALLSIGTS